MTMEHTPKKCYREGCENLRHSNKNPYCKPCRAAYQKALRVANGQNPDTITKADGGLLRGRPKRELDKVVLHFLEKISGVSVGE